MELFEIGFVKVTLVDVLDIAIVTFLFYKLYDSFKGGLTIRLASIVVSVFLIWKVVDLLGFRLLGSILNEFLSIGAIALVVLFAPEIRRLLTAISKNTLLERLLRQINLFSSVEPADVEQLYREIIESLKYLRHNHQGALIVLEGKDSLVEIRESGDRIDAQVSARLISAIFVKDSPLHDGAMMIRNQRIESARCILPLSQYAQLDPELGLRHRAGLGVSEISDALVFIASEERQEISLATRGVLRRNLNYQEVEDAIRAHAQST
ncbi:MAG: diadenylate cyclase CdaA [Bacteroidota bacterium]